MALSPSWKQFMVFFSVGLGSGSRCGDRGGKYDAALSDFGGALRHEPPKGLFKLYCFKFLFWFCCQKTQRAFNNFLSEPER
jgi:hypothetical protein